jgi:TRAP-type C4-dicarboxylate transport system substrate-binding protein
MKKGLLFCLAIVFVSVMVFATSNISGASEIIWDYAAGVPALPGSSHEKYTRAPLAEVIAQGTNGRLKLTVHEGLFPPPKVLDAVRDGTVDMGNQIPGYRGELALFNFLALPFIPREKVPEMRASLRPLFVEEMSEKYKAVFLGHGYFSNNMLATKDPVRTLDDLKGYKIRVHNQELAEMLKAAGANPVFMSAGEVYPALQRGVVKGAISTLSGIYALKIHEVCKNISAWPMGGAGYLWVANNSSWEKLPADLQKQVIDLFDKDLEMASFHGYLEDDMGVKKKMEAQGIKFLEVPPEDWNKYLKSYPIVYNRWKKLAGSRADELMAIVNKVLGTNY